MNDSLSTFIYTLPTSDQLDDEEQLADSYAYADTVADEDVSFYADLCNDDTLASCTRQYLMSYNDKTNSKSAEECYLKNVIRNNKTLADIAQREIEYEHKWKE